ncbi:MAG TPA: hypothetical protein VLZ83_07205 [Edaphocola sp.]|nr:hypothetical protein [Edaphocola sp.]
MNQQEIKNLIPEGFDDSSRVWIFQSTRPFTDQQVLEINEQLLHFTAQWVVHGHPVTGWGKLLFNRFIVMMAEEKEEKISGCSSDSMERVIKSIEKQYDCSLFDRLSITFLVKDKPEVLPMNQVQYAIDKDFINKDTLLFNNLVATKKELLEKWLSPLSESWMATRVKFKEENTTV